MLFYCHLIVLSKCVTHGCRFQGGGRTNHKTAVMFFMNPDVDAGMMLQVKVFCVPAALDTVTQVRGGDD